MWIADRRGSDPTSRDGRSRRSCFLVACSWRAAVSRRRDRKRDSPCLRMVESSCWLPPRSPAGARLWVRDLASAAFQPLPETEDASAPFWSPDSESIGFVAGGKLRTLRLAGGSPATVHATGFRYGAWSRDNLILFAPAGGSPLSTVPALGGTPKAATTLDQAGGEVQHEGPAFLPDGRRFLYSSMGSPSGALDPRGIYLASLDAPGQTRLLVPGATQPRYANGHVFFVQNGTLLAQPLDATSGTLRGAPLPLVEDVTLSIVGATGSTAAYSVSDNVLAYQAAVRTESSLMWFDRAGRALAPLTDPGGLRRRRAIARRRASGRERARPVPLHAGSLAL